MASSSQPRNGKVAVVAGRAQDTGSSVVQGSTESVLGRLETLNPKWLRVYWTDHNSSSKVRLVPMKRVSLTLRQDKPVVLSIAKAALGVLQNDTMVPGVTATGAFDLHPDWSTLRPGPAPGHVSCQGEFREETGLESVFCPRSLLRKMLEKAATHGLSFLVGFEIEFVVLDRTPDGPEKYRPIRHDDGHGWSTSRAFAEWGREGSLSTVLDEIVDLLDVAGIVVEQLHAESVPGQYEIVLPPLKPLQACDVLLHARQIIESTAARHGFRVTLHPKPMGPHACGSASHAHISIQSSGSEATPPHIYESFYAGILKHLRAITAFTCASVASYDRVVDGFWAGGRWVSWGDQNRETPLRKCKDSHWEFKAMDGTANPFLALAAIVAAGTKGVTDKAPLTWRDCKLDPANLTEVQREELGITEMLPASLDQALGALEEDEELIQLLHSEAVERFVSIKRAEIAFLGSMTPEERREWILERF